MPVFFWDFAKVQFSSTVGGVLPRRQRLRFQGLVASDTGDEIILTNQPLTGLQVVELATTPGLAEGEVRSCNGFYEAGDNGGGLFSWAIGESAGADGRIFINATGGQWQLIGGPSSANVLQFGAKADCVFNVATGVVTTPGTDNSAAIQAAANAGRVHFPPGTYRISQTIAYEENCVITCDCLESTKVIHTGTGPAFRVNGTETVFGGPNQQAAVTLFSMRNVLVAATAVGGSAMFFGTSLNPSIYLENAAFRWVNGKAVDCGEAVYFVTLKKCQFQYTGGVRARAADDQFVVENCNFGSQSDYDLDISTTSFEVTDCDFEGNLATAGNLGNIIVRGSATAETGYGSIRNTRFGPEDTHTPHDIVLSNAGTGGKALRGVKISGNRHHSHATTGIKVSPLLADCSFEGLDLLANTTNGLYSSGLYVTTSDPAVVFGGNPLINNYVDEIRLVQDSIKGAFQYRVKPDLIYTRRALCGQAFPAVHTVCWVAAYSAASSLGLPTIYSCVSYPWETRFACGVTTYVHAGSDVVHFAEEGSVVTTTLNTAASVSNDPVYMGAAGTLSLTPHADYVKIVGRVISLEANGRVRLDFSEPMRYTAMPAGGRFKIGDFAPKAVPVEAGAAASKYIIRGWERLTDSNPTVIGAGPLTGATGSNNTLNTDWFEVRTLTGN